MGLSCLRKALWIIVTLVAANFAALGVASAHDGHRTGAHAAASATAVVIFQHAEAKDDAALVAMALDAAGIENPSPACHRGLNDARPPSGDAPCTDGCCMGAGCCVAALAHAAPSLLRPAASTPVALRPESAWDSALGARLLEPPTPSA